MYFVSRIFIDFDEDTQKVTLDAEDVSAEQLLRTLSRNSGKTVFYDSLPAQPLTVRIKDGNFDQVLRLIITKYPDYTVRTENGGFYIVKIGGENTGGRESQQLSIGNKENLFSVAASKTTLPIIMRMLFSKAQKKYALLEEWYSGPATVAKAAALASAATEKGCDVVVGVGGGRALDLAKAAAALLRAPVITVPTSAATCAAYAPLSVLYHENGAYDHCVWHEREVDAVLVDMDIQSAQPPRLMASGILDAMAKYLEISNGRAELDLQDVPIAMHSAHSFARYTYEALERYGYRAVQDLKKGCRTKPLEDTVFLNIALTGMISGITKGRGQTSVAHALYDAVRTHFYRESGNFLHGEIVAVGLLSQLSYNEDEARLPVLRDYMRRLGMPCSLEEIGIRPSEKNLEVLYRDMCQQRFMVQDEAHLTRLKAALNPIR